MSLVRNHYEIKRFCVFVRCYLAEIMFFQKSATDDVTARQKFNFRRNIFGTDTATFFAPFLPEHVKVSNPVPWNRNLGRDSQTSSWRSRKKVLSKKLPDHDSHFFSIESEDATFLVRREEDVSVEIRQDKVKCRQYSRQEVHLRLQNKKGKRCPYCPSTRAQEVYGTG